VGHRGQDVALAAQHHGPQVVRPVDERVARESVQQEPRAGGDLLLQLARGPSRIPREHPDAGHAVADAVGVGRQVDRAEGAGDLMEAGDPLLHVGAGAGQADRRLGLHGAALEEDRRLARELTPVAQHVGHGDLGRPVQDHAEGAAGLVGHEQHHGAVEVRILEGRSRHQQPAGHRLHRPASDPLTLAIHGLPTEPPTALGGRVPPTPCSAH
jgi:hypothetical protein